MKKVALGDILTEDEIKQVAAMIAAGASAKRIADEVISPVIERINLDTRQENDALYLAYAIMYQIEQVTGG